MQTQVKFHHQFHFNSSFESTFTPNLNFKVKNDHRSKFSNLIKQLERRSLKKSRPQQDPVEALIFSGFFFPVA